MKTFNKATAATIAGAMATTIGAIWALDAAFVAAAQTVLTTILVFAIPNQGAAK